MRLTRLPTILRVLAIVLLGLAAARPRHGETTSAVSREGIAIQMVLDRSGSMEEEVEYRDRPRPKIEVVKEIFEDFVVGGDELPGRPNDVLGLTTFARFAEENCPLVSLHEPLLTAVANLETVPPFITRSRTPTRRRADAAAGNPLSATAIGEGLKRAVLALVAGEQDLRRAGAEDEEAYRIRGKAVILLTDGQHNAGIDPAEAAALAKANDVRVYSIVLFSRDVEVNTLFGSRVSRRLSDSQLEQVIAIPRQIAEETGGRFYLAADGDALRDVYAEIDELERVELEDLEFRTWHERFAWPLLIGIGLLLLAQVLDETWLRRTP